MGIHGAELKAIEYRTVPACAQTTVDGPHSAKTDGGEDHQHHWRQRREKRNPFWLAGHFIVECIVADSILRARPHRDPDLLSNARQSKDSPTGTKHAYFDS